MTIRTTLLFSPGRVVGDDLVHVANVDHILGLALVVGDAGVLEPVAPEYLIREVGGPHLDSVASLWSYSLQAGLIRVLSGLTVYHYCRLIKRTSLIVRLIRSFPSNVTMISNCFLK